ncbi:MAG: AraC family ligand binding domain-containing protein [Lachnospiraceae bacterium]|nr:AraC family ligand binding domain-containing protein [Lachnospiraceae bacterium]
MNEDMLIRYLEQYDPMELFYHAHSTKLKHPSDFLDLLVSQDPETLRSSSCVLLEYTGDSRLRLLLNPYCPDGMGQRNVRLVRLCRCVPVFAHTHNYFEILYVLRGSCRHRTARQVCQMEEGDLMLVSPSVCHSVYAGSHDLIISILISSDLIEILFSAALRGRDSVSDFLRNSIFQKDYASWLLFHTAGDEEIRRQILDMYLEEFQADEYADRIIASMLSVFFIKLTRKYKRSVEIPVSAPPSPCRNRLYPPISAGKLRYRLFG